MCVCVNEREYEPVVCFGEKGSAIEGLVPRSWRKSVYHPFYRLLIAPAAGIFEFGREE